jgi:methanogenic corrinoid protein MtbC1
MIKLEEIYKKSTLVDGESLMIYLAKQIKEGKHETYLEALAEYVEEKEIDLNIINKILTPTLREIIRFEAEEKRFFKNVNVNNLKQFI